MKLPELMQPPSTIHEMTILENQIFIMFAASNSHIAVYDAAQARQKMEVAYARRRARINAFTGPMMVTDGPLSVKRTICLNGLTSLTTVSDITVTSVTTCS
jgi:hypothetical protein